MRMNANDVVTAYKVTGLIPIRKAWQSEDSRGGCAIDAVSRWLDEDSSGEPWATDNLNHDYVKGFLDAWDSDEPKILNETENPKEFLIGYWDAMLCREAVEKEFTSITEVQTS
jgi:hypothetical protein